MNKQQREGAFFHDITPEEIKLFQNYFESQPNGERVHRGILEWLGEKMYELAAEGEVLSCYTDETERALHPDCTDVRSLIPLQRPPERDHTWEDFGRAAI